MQEETLNSSVCANFCLFCKMAAPHCNTGLKTVASKIIVEVTVNTLIVDAKIGAISGFRDNATMTEFLIFYFVMSRA